MKMLTVLVVLMLSVFSVTPHETRYGETENSVGFMFAWPNPDPCGGEECLGASEQGADV
jgi:hypothetical protein